MGQQKQCHQRELNINPYKFGFQLTYWSNFERLIDPLIFTLEVG